MVRYDMDELLTERYELAKQTLRRIADSEESVGQYDDFFHKNASFLLLITDVCDTISSWNKGEYDDNLLAKWNEEIYRDVTEANYDNSYVNPDHSCEAFGKDLGRILSVVAAEMRSAVGYAYENQPFWILIRMELLLEVYGYVRDCLTDGEAVNTESIREMIYWYVSDYSDVWMERRVHEMVDSSMTFATDIIMESDLNNVNYLYRYGEYITDNEIKLAQFVNSLDETDIEKMAAAYTEGYRIGFEVTGKDLSIKDTVNIRYPLGMERIVRCAIRNFDKMGLKPVIYRAGSNLFIRHGMNKIGYYGANPCKQMDFDHKEDEALFLEGNFVTRKLECLEQAFKQCCDMAYRHAGPAVIESFGEAGYQYINKENAVSLDDKQQLLKVRYATGSGKITNEYIRGEERSFTIISFPVPAIGKDFEEIFRATIRINTLDYNKFRDVQNIIIEALDRAEYVEVKGMNGNNTDMKVRLVHLENPDEETKFENCVADVNIPVGEVFTSPVLKGTEGILHVKRVFLDELEYKNLSIEFKDGMITDYTCDNYESREACRKYIKDNILFHHDTLPIGEFAIGTNTLAYEMAKHYDIFGRLPILIAEKTGPHFAVGDTCYSHEEELVTYNPDGKRIVARSNEIVDKYSKQNPAKAYFNCHTDITIPYDELGYIHAVTKENDRIKIIENGKFVLKGTEELNVN